MKFRIHVLGVPHTATDKNFVGCAFTQKVWKFLQMMSGRGHTIYHYGHTTRDWDYSDVEHVPVTNDAVLTQAYGLDYVVGESWKRLGFGQFYNVQDSAYTNFHANAIKEINLRKKPNDILLCFFGWGHKPIADAHPDLIAIEPGIGYGATCLRWKIYESNHMRSAAGGLDSVNNCNIDDYSVVIPNYFSADDFEFSDKKSDYILYLGRIYSGKGVDILMQLAQHTDKQIVIAGQGSLAQMGYKPQDIPDNVTEFGYADVANRRQLLKQASALFIGSRYAEPFAGVQVEAWLSGTPVISPDHSCFAEMNHHMITGYRCRTFSDYVQALEDIDYLLPDQIYQYGQRYTLERVAPQYERYFQDVTNVYTTQGWYTL
jgi:glycosyltransferase involved in cell wall biosynthesis